MITVTQSELDIAQLEALGQPEPVEDPTDYRGHVVLKPWGREYEVYRDAGQSIWRLELLPNSETSMHCHIGKTTILIVHSGVVDFSTLSKRFTMCSGGIIVIEKGVFHKTETKSGATIFEIESPASKADLVRLADRYGRQGQGYEIPQSNQFP